MAHPGFGRLWKQHELSDIDIELCVDSHDAAPARDSSRSLVVNKKARYTVLQRFPGHKTIISLSPYCKAQVLRWQSETAPGTVTSKSSCHTSTAKQQVKLTLPDASYDTAALALLQILYLVKPVTEVLAGLTQEQQVQAAVLADMWQVPVVGSTAVELLTDAANSAAGLSAAALEQMLGMLAVPDCLLVLFERALLSRLGDLEAAWTDARLRDMLMTLPLFAMELLLSSDKLKITSEDTVLYTAQAYVDKLPNSEQQDALDRLAPLVRFPHLSQLWLSAAGLSGDAVKLLSGLRPQVKQFVLARQLGCNLTAEEIKSDIQDAPASWLLPSRVSKATNSVQVQWDIDILAIKKAVLKSASSRASAYTVPSSSPASAPLLGVTWQMSVVSNWDEKKQGSSVGVYAKPANLPANTYCQCTFTLERAGSKTSRAVFHRFKAGGAGWGWADFFGVGPMSGGFDEVAWAAKGLPTSGQLVLKLSVESIPIE